MTTENTPTLQSVFSYVEEVYRNCRLMIMDAAHGLRNVTGRYFEHVSKWDYVSKHGDHFLDDQRYSASRCWVSYLPQGELKPEEEPIGGAMFSIQFHAKRVVEPSLIFGSFLWKPDYPEADYRWAPYHAVVHAEENRKDVVTVEEGRVLTKVRGHGTNYFAETVLVRVPLEAITDTNTLKEIVVRPLAAMVRKDYEEAEKLLADIRIPWPIGVSAPEEAADVDEEEQA